MEKVEWAVHVFGRERVSGVEAQSSPTAEDIPSIDELLKTWTLADLPRNLGRLTKFLMSTNQKQRLRGLQVLHRRFWHAKDHAMRTILDRGGIDLSDEEIKLVIAACPVCRKWKSPPLPPRVKTSLPDEFNELVDFDIMSIKDSQLEFL